jgi:hypothetical protein
MNGFVLLIVKKISNLNDNKPKIGDVIMSAYKTKPRLITQTGSHKKVIVNMEIAEEILDKDFLKSLNHILIELNHIQETELDCITCKGSGMHPHDHEACPNCGGTGREDAR